MMYYIGVDPGFDGAIGLIRQDNSGLSLSTNDIPVIEEINDQGKTRRWYDIHKLVKVLDDIRTFWDDDFTKPEPAFVLVIEDLNPNPEFGSRVNRQLGICYGAIVSAALSMKWKVTHVSPQGWRKHFALDNLPKEERKKESIKRLLAIYPDAEPLLMRRRTPRSKPKPSHDRAEALLIARYQLEMDQKEKQ